MYIDHTNPELYQNESFKKPKSQLKDKNKKKRAKKSFDLNFLNRFKSLKKDKNDTEESFENFDFNVNNIKSDFETQEEEKKEKLKLKLNNPLKKLKNFKKSAKKGDKKSDLNIDTATLIEDINEEKSELKPLSSTKEQTPISTARESGLQKTSQSQVLQKYQELLKKKNFNQKEEKDNQSRKKREYEDKKEDIIKEPLDKKSLNEETPFSYTKKSNLKERVLNKYQDLISKKSKEKKRKIPARIEKITPISNDKEITKDFIPFEFKGKAGEFFKIWIVNILLSIVTLGIYSAWAKVRTNQYLYANTFLNGANFFYAAEPKRILYGRVIVVLFYGLFLLFGNFLEMTSVAMAIFAIFIILLPWLIRQAIRFKLKNTSYRNIKFNFKADILSFYILGFLFILPFILFTLIPIALGFFKIDMGNIAAYTPFLILGGFILTIFIYYPFLYHKYKSVVINNSYYGLESFEFYAKKSDVIKIFIKIALITLLFSIFLGLLSFGGKYIFTKYLNIHLNIYNKSDFLILYFISALLYLAFIGFYKGLSDAYISNLVRDNTRIKDCYLKSTIEPLKLAFISSTNTILLLCSVGLLYPYTKIRYLKYKIQNTHFACDDYHKFDAARSYQVNSLGEEAIDFFDIDVGI